MARKPKPVIKLKPRVKIPRRSRSTAPATEILIGTGGSETAAHQVARNLARDNEIRGELRYAASRTPAKPASRMINSTVAQLVGRATENVKKGMKRTNPVALSVALPGVYPPVRHPSAWNNVPSAAASLHNVTTADFSTLTTDLFPQVPAGQFMAGVSRDPFHAFVQPFNIGATLVPQSFLLVNAMFPKNTYVTTSAPTTPIRPTVAISYATMVPIACGSEVDLCLPVALPYETNTGLAKSTMYAFHIGGRNAYYITSQHGPAGFNLTQVFVQGIDGAMNTPGGVMVVAERWDGSEWQPVTQAYFTGTGVGKDFEAALSIPLSQQYISLRLVDTNGMPGVTAYSVATTIKIRGAYWHFSPIPGIEDHFNTLTNLNVSAASLMFSPNMNELNAAGEIVGLQLETGVEFSSYFDFDKITDRVGYKMLPYTKGMYGFIKPSSEKDFDLRKIFSVSQYQQGSYGTRPMCVTPIPMPVEENTWIIMSCKCPVVAGVVPSASLYITVNYNVIFNTESQWILEVRPKYDPQQFGAYLSEIRDADQFYENPFHVRDLMTFFKSAGKHTLRIGGKIMKFLGPILAAAQPEFAPAIFGAELLVDGLNSVVN